MPVTKSETGAKCAAFVHGEWVRKCDSFARAMVVGVSMNFIFILFYISIIAPNVSFVFSVVNLVGDWVTPLHP